VRTTSPVTVDKIYYLDTILPTARLGSFPQAELRAFGPLIGLDTPVNVSVQKAVTTDAPITEILDKASWSSTARDIDTGLTTITRWAPGELNALTAARQVEATEGGFLREAIGEGAIAFDNRDHRFSEPFQTSQITFSDEVGASGVVRYKTIDEKDILALIYNDVRATVQSYTVSGSATLWQHPEADTAGNAPTTFQGQTITFSAQYPNRNTATDGADHVDAWTTPTLGSGNAIEVWSQSDGGGSDLGASFSVVVSKFDKNMKIALTNDGEVDGFMTVCDIAGTPVTKDNPVTVIAEDTASQTAFGVKMFPESAVPQFIPDTAEGNEWALWTLSCTKDPLATVTLAGDARRDLFHAHKYLRADVNDRVTLKADGTDTKLGLTDRPMYVEIVRWSISESKTVHSVTLDLSDAAAYSGGWIVGRSILGESTKVMRS